MRPTKYTKKENDFKQMNQEADIETMKQTKKIYTPGNSVTSKDLAMV